MMDVFLSPAKIAIFQKDRSSKGLYVILEIFIIYICRGYMLYLMWILKNLTKMR